MKKTDEPCREQREGGSGLKSNRGFIVYDSRAMGGGRHCEH